MSSQMPSHLESVEHLFGEILKKIPEGARNINIGLSYKDNENTFVLTYWIKEENDEKEKIVEKKFIKLDAIPIPEESNIAFIMFMTWFKNIKAVSEMSNYINELLKNGNNEYRFVVVIKQGLTDKKKFQLVLYNYDSENTSKYYNFIHDFLLNEETNKGFLYEETSKMNKEFFKELEQIGNSISEEDEDTDFLQEPKTPPGSWAAKFKDSISPTPLQDFQTGPIIGNNEQVKNFSEILLKKMKPSSSSRHLPLTIITPSDNSKAVEKKNVQEQISDPPVLSFVSKITFDGEYFPVSIIDGKPVFVKPKTQKDLKLESAVSNYKKIYGLSDDQEIPKEIYKNLVEINDMSTKDIPEISEFEIKDNDDLSQFLRVSVNGKAPIQCHFDDEDGKYFYVSQRNVIKI